MQQQRIMTMTNRETPEFPNADGRQLLTGLSPGRGAPCSIAQCMRKKAGRNDASSSGKRSMF